MELFAGISSKSERLVEAFKIVAKLIIKQSNDNETNDLA
jgi:hypothetical protein